MFGRVGVWNTADYLLFSCVLLLVSLVLCGQCFVAVSCSSFLWSCAVWKALTEVS